MKIPKILLGTGKEVHPKISRLMAKAKKTRVWPEFSDEEMVDTQTIPLEDGHPRILLDIDPAIGGETHFRLYAPSRYFKFSEGHEPLWEDIRFVFDNLIRSQWGLLALLYQAAHVPTVKEDRERGLLFFQSLVEHWDSILEEKPFLANPDPPFGQGTYFWNSVGTQLWYLMAEAGVPKGLHKELRWTELTNYQAHEWIVGYILKPHS